MQLFTLVILAIFYHKSKNFSSNLAHITSTNTSAILTEDESFIWSNFDQSEALNNNIIQYCSVDVLLILFVSKFFKIATN